MLYLENTATYSDIPPLKNGLQSLCKAIRQHHRTCRMFITNLLPSPSSSPQRRTRNHAEFTLLQAIRSANRALGKIHYLSLFEHFVSCRKTTTIRPTHKYFTEDFGLTPLGCMVMRECIIWEAGLKTYWW